MTTKYDTISLMLLPAQLNTPTSMKANVKDDIESQLPCVGRHTEVVCVGHSAKENLCWQRDIKIQKER